MIDKIFDETYSEYKEPGHLIIDEENYYTIKKFKEEFLGEHSSKQENQADSEELKKYLHSKTFKIKPEEGDMKYVLTYSLDLLKEYYT